MTDKINEMKHEGGSKQIISLAGKRMKPDARQADGLGDILYHGVLIVGNSQVRRKPTPISVYFRHAHDNGVEEAEDVLVGK